MSKQTIQGRFWIKKDDRNFLGEGKIELLRNINATGSISAAAKLMKMSYKAAWDDVDAMNNIADTPLVERTVGGKSGGGTRLTAEGVALLDYFDRVHGYFKRFMDDMLAVENNDAKAEYIDIRTKMLLLFQDYVDKHTLDECIEYYDFLEGRSQEDALLFSLPMIERYPDYKS
jgi:molybdate transport repressor ModE-like protein